MISYRQLKSPTPGNPDANGWATEDDEAFSRITMPVLPGRHTIHTNGDFVVRLLIGTRINRLL